MKTVKKKKKKKKKMINKEEEEMKKIFSSQCGLLQLLFLIYPIFKILQTAYK
jgi:hypothetical protein